MIHPLEQWFLWFVLYSFIGWMYESILCSVAGKKLVNRGFLNGRCVLFTAPAQSWWCSPFRRWRMSRFCCF